MQRLRLRRSSAVGSPARSTCSTSRPSASTRATRSACSRNLRALVDMGSTVLVVEHDAETIRAADHVIDLGPGGGQTAVTSSPRAAPATVLAIRRLTDRPRAPRAARRRASAAADQRRVDRPRRRTRATTCSDVTFRVPVGRMCVVAGVSGSGKSHARPASVFFPALRRALASSRPPRDRTARSRAPRPCSARSGRRSVAHRAHAAQRACDVPRRLGRGPEALRRAAGVEDRAATRRRASPSTARDGRPLHRVRRPGIDRRRDVLFCPTSSRRARPARASRFEPSTLDVR